MPDAFDTLEKIIGECSNHALVLQSELLKKKDPINWPSIREHLNGLQMRAGVAVSWVHWIQRHHLERTTHEGGGDELLNVLPDEQSTPPPPVDSNSLPPVDDRQKMESEAFKPESYALRRGRKRAQAEISAEQDATS